MQSIDFNGRSIQVVTDEQGRAWVSVRHVCEVLGVSNQGQHKRLAGEGWACQPMLTHDATGRVPLRR